MNTPNNKVPTHNASTDHSAVGKSQENHDGDKTEKPTTTAAAPQPAPQPKQTVDNKQKQKEKEPLKPNTITCSFCNLPETPTRNFDKMICLCKSTRYCNTTCQRNHWKDHKKNCNHLIAERRRKKQLKKEQRERDANATSVDSESLKTTPVNDKTAVDLWLKKYQRACDEKEKKEAEDEGDECPICLEELPRDMSTFTRMVCCGNGLHAGCAKDLMSTKMANRCILCRAKTPSTDRESVKYLRPHVKKKKAWAQYIMGQMYSTGSGVKQSYKKTRRLYELAAQQGHLNAKTALGVMYSNGDGVEQSNERAKEYYEHAAHLGDAGAQFYLGNMWLEKRDVDDNLMRASKWWVKAALQGHAGAIGKMKIFDEHVNRWKQNGQLFDSNGQRLEIAEDCPFYEACSNCESPQTETQKLIRCPCHSVQYCNKTCQAQHRKKHKKECRKLLAEKKLKKEKQMATTTTPPQQQRKEEEEEEGERKD